MRAAFNAYTNNLVFGENYLLTANKEDRKRLIRDDRLPDVTSVIRSDLDLRDLYRNQVLTALDDAKAELQYQLKNYHSPSSTISNKEDTSKLDPSDLVGFLREAQSSCSKWFSFVPQNDLDQALTVVARAETGA